jgi:hypothetical protein
VASSTRAAELLRRCQGAFGRRTVSESPAATCRTESVVLRRLSSALWRHGPHSTWSRGDHTMRWGPARSTQPPHRSSPRSTPSCRGRLCPRGPIGRWASCARSSRKILPVHGLRRRGRGSFKRLRPRGPHRPLRTVGALTVIFDASTPGAIIQLRSAPQGGVARAPQPLKPQPPDWGLGRFDLCSNGGDEPCGTGRRAEIRRPGLMPRHGARV